MKHDMVALAHDFDSWNGLGAVIVGKERFGYDLDVMRQDGIGWRAKFYDTGLIHSFTRWTGSVFEPMIFRAVQKAARDASREQFGRPSPESELLLSELGADQRP
jgi:hypothetical protein